MFALFICQDYAIHFSKLILLYFYQNEAISKPMKCSGRETRKMKVFGWGDAKNDPIGITSWIYSLHIFHFGQY